MAFSFGSSVGGSAAPTPTAGGFSFGASAPAPGKTRNLDEPCSWTVVFFQN